MSTKVEKRAIQELSVDSRLLYKRLLECKIDETIPYSELSQIVGRDVQREAYTYLATARKMALRDDRIVFGVVRTVGLKRLDDESVVRSANGTMSRMHRQAIKGIKQIECVDNFDILPNNMKVAHNTARSLFGVFEYITRPKQVKRLEAYITEAQAQLPLAKTLEFFK